MMNPWRLWQQGFCMLGLSFVLGIATTIYQAIRINQLQRQMLAGNPESMQSTLGAMFAPDLLGSMLSWSAVITFVIAVGLLLLGLISYCGQRAKCEPPR